MTSLPLRRRSFVRTAGLLGTMLVAAFATGCGSTTKIQNQQSVGQQLQDLEKSYKDGIISEKEYEKLKRAIIRAND